MLIKHINQYRITLVQTSCLCTQITDSLNYTRSLSENFIFIVYVFYLMNHIMANLAQAQSTQTPYRVTLTNPQGQIWYADEPVEKGGQDTAPNPIQILLSALGACTVITLEMYANHKGLKIEHVQLDLALNPDGDPELGQNNILRKITLKGDFSEEQHKRLLKVAESCPVHKLLTSNIQIQTNLNLA